MVLRTAGVDATTGIMRNVKRYLWVAILVASASQAGTPQTSTDTYSAVAGDFQRLVAKYEAKTTPTDELTQTIRLEYRAEMLFRTVFSKRNTSGLKDAGYARATMELDALGAIRTACGDFAARALAKGAGAPVADAVRDQLWINAWNAINLFKKVDAKL